MAKTKKVKRKPLWLLHYFHKKLGKHIKRHPGTK